MPSIRRSIRQWWDGRYVPYENDPRSQLVFIGGGQEWHWTAKAARAVVFFAAKEWRWLIPVLLTCFGLFIAYLRVS